MFTAREIKETWSGYARYYHAVTLFRLPLKLTQPTASLPTDLPPFIHLSQRSSSNNVVHQSTWESGHEPAAIDSSNRSATSMALHSLSVCQSLWRPWQWGATERVHEFPWENPEYNWNCTVLFLLCIFSSLKWNPGRTRSILFTLSYEKLLLVGGI